MRTRIGKTVLLLSLVTALGCAALWPRSYTRGDGVLLFGGRAGTAAAASCQGVSVICVSNVNVGPERTFTVQGVSADAEELTAAREEIAEPMQHKWERWSFAAGFADRGTIGVPGAWHAVLVVPHWFWLTLSLPAPALWARRTIRTMRRARRGLCPECGYDLRATTSGQCPECGRAVVTAPSTRMVDTAGS